MDQAAARPITADDLSRRDEALIKTVEEIVQRQAPGGWHLDRKVPISIIVTLLGLAATGLWHIGDLRAEIKVLQAEVDAHRDYEARQRERDERQDKALAEALALLRADLQKANDKLDRLIEKRTQ